MLVTVYMSVKNGLPYVSEAINSVLNQTYTDWEMIIVDDGSSDRTAEYLEEMRDRDSRIKAVIAGGVGRSRALNMAISQAQGVYIANLDADDYFHPRKLEYQLAAAKSGDIDVLCSGYLVFNSGAPDFADNRCESRVIEVTSKLLFTNPVNHSSVLMKRSLWNSGFRYNEDLNRLVDYRLWSDLAMQKVSIYLLDEVLVGKRVHANQSYENKRRWDYLRSDFIMRKELISSLDGGFIYHFINCFKFTYGLLPQQVRMQIKRSLPNKVI